MINKIKETLGQVFFSPEASGTWEEKIECAIDEVTVKCEDLEAPIQECGPGHLTQGYGFLGYTGIPAPAYLEDDPWFGPAPVSDENKEYEHINDDPQMEWWLTPEYQDTKESPNIHQEMYDSATKSGKTTTNLILSSDLKTFKVDQKNVHR